MRPIQARISIGAMAHNLRVARSHAGATRVFAVVKANAYGHGLSRARRALAAADGVAVLTLEEAANLRLMGVDQPILLLEGFFGVDEIATCAELDLWPVLHHPAHLDWLQQQPPARPLQVFLKFDSGMHRLGFPLADHAAIVARARSLSAVAGITQMTHFAQADETAGVDWQLHPFLRELSAYGLPWRGAICRPGGRAIGFEAGHDPAVGNHQRAGPASGRGCGVWAVVSCRPPHAGGCGCLRLCGWLPAPCADRYAGSCRWTPQPNLGPGVDGHAVCRSGRMPRSRRGKPGRAVGRGFTRGYGSRSRRHQQL